MSVSEELARLAQLRDQGVLSPEEFAAQKAKVLAGTPPPSDALPSKGKKRGIGCLSIILVIVVLIFAGSIGNRIKEHSAGEPAADGPARDVTARELAQAYSANEVSAQSTYGNQALRVTGIVQGITLDFKDDPVIQFTTDNQFLPAQASFDKSFGTRLQSVSKGQSLTVTCKSISEVISAPMLSDCSL